MATHEKRGAGGMIHDTRTWSLAQVANAYPHIIQPPSPVWDLQNKSGLSKFPPGMPPEFYDPFIAYFEERAQTAAAQARLYQRKLKGEHARRWLDHERGWRRAARVALMRKQRELLKTTPIPEAEVERPPFEWDDPAENPIAELAEAIDAAPKVAEAPFSLEREVARQKTVQKGLFD